MLENIKLGSKGKAVDAWQYFLLGVHFYGGAVDGDFGPSTDAATRAFQTSVKLKPDGSVGRDTYAQAMLKGFNPVHDEQADLDDIHSPGWPGRPDFKPLTVLEKHKLFGTIEFKPAENPADPEAVIITNDWKSNIKKFAIPQLVGVVGAGKLTQFDFHEKVGKQVQALFQAWEDHGHKDLIISFAGSWVPRFVRGSRTSLSSHAWGTAFDINAAWNARGSRPALVGEKGSVRELVTIAYDHGFWWGGYFDKPDGMHMEVAQIL